MQDGGNVHLEGPVVCQKINSSKKNGILNHDLWLSGMKIICRGEFINVSSSETFLLGLYLSESYFGNQYKELLLE